MEFDKYRKQELYTKATLIGIFLTIFAGFASRIRFKTKKRKELVLKPFDLVLLSLST